MVIDAVTPIVASSVTFCAGVNVRYRRAVFEELLAVRDDECRCPCTATVPLGGDDDVAIDNADTTLAFGISIVPETPFAGGSVAVTLWLFEVVAEPLFEVDAVQFGGVPVSPAGHAVGAFVGEIGTVLPPPPPPPPHPAANSAVARNAMRRDR